MERFITRTSAKPKQSSHVPDEAVVAISSSKHGFNNFKKAIERCNGHQTSNLHRAAAVVLVSVERGTNVVAALSLGHLKQMRDNRSALLNILTTLLALARQGLAIRGHTDEDSNLNAILSLRGRDVPELQTWLQRTEYKWMSHDIVNEMLAIMSHNLLRGLMKEIHDAKFFSIILDETADVSIKEQVSVVFRIAKEDLQVEEIFLGFYQTSSTTSQTLFAILKDVLLRFGYDMENCRGQCYDGASNMAGHRHGLQTLVQEVAQRAIYVHCFAHNLNLVVQDAAMGIAKFRDLLVFVRELIGFIRNSPKRLACFERCQEEGSVKLLPFCPTRWTVRAKSLKTVLANYSSVIEFLGLAAGDHNEAGAKAHGLHLQLHKLETYLGLNLLYLVFSRVETVNTALQKVNLRFHEAAVMIENLKTIVAQLREGFEDFFSKTTSAANDLDVELEEHFVQRRARKIPRRLDEGSVPHVFESPKDLYRQGYYELMDLTLVALSERFNTTACDHMVNIEQFVTGNASSDYVMNFYKTDFHECNLELHRNMFLELIQRDKTPVMCFQDVFDLFQGERGRPMRNLFPELARLLQIAVTIPVSSCSSERSFSCLRRIKTYLRATMGQARLNAVALLHGHKDEAAHLDVEAIADEFIQRTVVRKNTFSLGKVLQ
ncbi:zinc finger MYM-type protein 1-like [Ambystoma mexicanum]|uniref:zinc finger MYM-type protein 1-like n=1 Tax=Ambystoma mexicanum TaxID=8296 RepID=UPI0037E6F803